MSETPQAKSVRVAELADRYILVDTETGEEVDGDGVGFSYESSAKEYAERQGYTIVD